MTANTPRPPTPAPGDAGRNAEWARCLDEHALRRLGDSFADAANRREYDRFAELFTEDGAWEIGPPIDVAFAGHDEIRSGVERMLGRWDFFAQMPHAFFAEIVDDRAIAYWTVQEIARSKDGAQGNSNVSLYLDDAVRTPDGWRFQRRRYRTIYSDTTPLVGQTFHLDPADLHRIGRNHRQTLHPAG